MDRSAVREGIGYASTLVVIVLSLLTAMTVVGKIVVGFAGGSSGESGLPPGALPHVQIFAATLLVLLPVLIAPLAHHSAGFGARLPARPRAPRFLTAAALTWLAMGACGIANAWIRHFLGHEQWTGISSTHTISDSEMTFLAVNAGLGEEAEYLAVPIGLVYLAGSLLNLRRERHGKLLLTPNRLWLISVIIGGGIALIARGAGHLYQGPVSAVLALVWGAALAAVFLWVRSIWPVMLGHFIYDIPTNYDSWPALIVHHIVAPAVLAALGGVILYALRHSSVPGFRRRQVPYTS